MTTATLQYQLDVKNGETTQEVGSFFKANPFQIILDSVTVNVRLIHDDHKEVVYEVTSNSNVLIHLEHPDYTPECEQSDLTTHIALSQDHAETLLAALIRLGVSKGKWKATLEPKKSSQSYSIKQPQFL